MKMLCALATATLLLVGCSGETGSQSAAIPPAAAPALSTSQQAIIDKAATIANAIESSSDPA